MKTFFGTIFVLVILGLIGLGGYYAYDYISKKNSLQFTPIESPDGLATSTDPGNIQATSTDIVATSTVDTSMWKTYKNQELGFELKYPANLILNESDLLIVLAFPKDVYFHWPLLDNAKITVIASSSCARQSLDETDENPTKLTIDGKLFSVRKDSGVAAGNIYGEIIYDSKTEQSSCYSLIYYSHGANGAGRYVDDPVMIKKYDSQHATDLESVKETVYGILASFKRL